MNRTHLIRGLLVFMAIALPALGVAACGGSDTTDATTAAEIPATDKTERQQDQSQDQDKGSAEEDGPGRNGEKKESQQGGGKGSDGEQQQEAQPDAESSSPEPEPSESAAKGIRGFGEEASAAEREAVSDLVEGFLQGREDKEWKVVCAAAAKPVVAPLERLAARNPQLKGSGCVALLTLVGKQSSAPDFESNMAGPVTSFRVKGNRGFAIYDGTDDGEFAMPMLLEGGDWKVGSFEARELS